MKRYDLIVIGAGPAGMAMAIECAQAGMDVLLLDDQPEAGGQIYRTVTKSRLTDSEVFSDDYWRGSKLVAALKCQNLTHVTGARVWYARPSGDVWFSVNRESVRASAKFLAIAVGARERPVAVPGWTLPGVFSAGAAQVLLKSAGLAADNLVLAGSGPLLYLLASQYIAAGKKVKALLDTTPWSNYQAAIKTLPGAIFQRQLYKGLKLLARIRLAGVPVYHGVNDLRIDGDQAVEEISWKQRGRAKRILCEAVLLHEGLIPNIEFALALGCEWSWSSERCTWELKTNESGETSLPGIYALGDCARIIGADASEIQGRLAGVRLARKAINKPPGEQEQALAHELARHMRFRSFLDQLYLPADENLLSHDPNTVVCRCENVTVDTLIPLIERSHGDLNFVKSLTRCGMGPCQGRMCSHSVATLGRFCQIPPGAPSRQRLPLAPITIGELAAMEDSE